MYLWPKQRQMMSFGPFDVATRLEPRAQTTNICRLGPSLCLKKGS